MTRARLYVGLGAALAMLATMVIVAGRGNDYFQIVPGRLVAASVLPPLVAGLGLGLLDRRARIGALLVLVAAGSMLGLVSITSADGAGLLWLPGALLLTLGGFRLRLAQRQGQKG